MPADRSSNPPPPRDPLRLLSAREAEVLDTASLGLTNAQIAKRMGITVHTVKFHLAAIYRKLGAANRTEAIVRAFQARMAAEERARRRAA